MKILLSPAKSLDYSTKPSIEEESSPIFLSETKKIQTELKKMKPSDLKELMGISDKLATLNYERNQDRTLRADAVSDTVKQAIFAFDGDVYSGIDAYTISAKKSAYLQETVRILSGLYGLLRPFDLIEPYRLEMGTKMPVGKAENLYEFWQTTVTKALQKQLEKDEAVVNLASNEYFKAIDAKELKKKHTIITPIFKDYKNGKLKVISFYAKKARGLMTRFAIDNEIKNPEDLKKFSCEGYQFQEADDKKNEWLFTR